MSSARIGLNSFNEKMAQIKRLSSFFQFKIKLRWALFVTYTILQSITSSEMCSLYLTHPSAHTWSSGQPTRRRPGSSWGFSALLKGLTSVVDNSCQSRDTNPQPRITSPTLYSLGHDCLHAFQAFIVIALECNSISETTHRGATT